MKKMISFIHIFQHIAHIGLKCNSVQRIYGGAAQQMRKKMMKEEN
jgi:hypothetical protein